MLETREEQALREVGHTDVRPLTARVVAAVFPLIVASVPALEIVRDLRGRDASPWAQLAAAPAAAWPVARSAGALAGNRALLASMTAFEDALDERSLLTERLLPHVQWLLTRHLGAGNEQVVVGRGGWLYFRPALDYVTGPGFLEPEVLARKAAGGPTWEPRPRPDPVPALADFAAQLAERGIGLVVVPTPVKAAVHPEGLGPVDATKLPLDNPSFERFLERLADLEIPAYTPGPRFSAALRQGAWPRFLRTDTHWTPQSVEDAAAGLAEFLARHVALRERNQVVYTRREAWATGRGDLAALLNLPARRPLFRPEPALTRPVLMPAGEPWFPDPAADVLVLGDSFTNIYSQPELGWGEGAGFAEQLAFHLRRPVDKFAINAGGPAAVREQLAARLAAGEDRLAGKRLVIYQFSARELAAGDWRLVDLAPSAAREGAASRPRRAVEARPARGFVVWESSRNGDWRIWMRRLEGSPPRRVSRDEPELQHCCAHVSPAGTQLAYLSRPVPRDDYPEVEAPGELRIVDLASGSERALVGDARPYGYGNRAVVWRDERELVYIGADGRTRLLDVAAGQSRRLTDEPRDTLAWLLDATLTHAVKGWPVFSEYDAAGRRVVEGRRYPGCEPYFSHDGRFGFWVERAAGPVRFIDLTSGRKGVLLDNEDQRIPGAQRYAYFPMLSRDSRMLAFGASPGDHDHFKSNYDIFVAPVDPSSLELLGRPLRMTAHPAGDRYPDVHVESLDVERWRREAPPVPVAGAPEPPLAAGPVDVRAVLRACSRVPSLREISPYRDALVVCEWRVTEVLAGEPEGGTLRVAHWGLRNGRRQPITSAAPGLEERLRAQPLVGAVQIEGYAVSDTLPAAPGLPLYHAP